MPELPEVQTIRAQIAKTLLGQTICEIKISNSVVVRGDLKILEGKKLEQVRRFGKLLVLDFSDQISLAIHLKMTGRLTLLSANQNLLPHTHVVFTLKGEGGSQPQGGSQPAPTHTHLAFSDLRRFGFLHAMPTEQVLHLPFLQKLGKEPLKDLTLPLFISLCAKSKRPIKTMLLDQHKIAGIGNIYACESLWMAQIDPETLACKLTQTQIKLLFEAIETVLKEGIARGGASDSDFLDLYGHKGSYQEVFKVYNRKGKPCLICGAALEFTKLGGRGTYYCKMCQA